MSEPAARQLQVWLGERADGFGVWGESVPCPSGRWDFTPESLDALEELVRSRYDSEADIHAGRLDPFLQGAIWYVGETACRTKGLVWHYWPFAPRRAQLPDLFTEPGAGCIDTPSVGRPGAREGQGTDPLGLMLTLFWDKDDTGRPTSTRLRGILN